jgi:diacylglycerol kinase (ATP)
MQVESPPPVAVLPLGTGNDLARVLRWGPGYAGQRLANILVQVADAEERGLDRWAIASTPLGRDGPEDADQDQPQVAEALPLDVINNYFSFGADAHTALSFHLARERDPKRFTSRLGNKLYYGMAGGKQIIAPAWKDMYKYVSLWVCWLGVEGWGCIIHYPSFACLAAGSATGWT